MLNVNSSFHFNGGNNVEELRITGCSDLAKIDVSELKNLKFLDIINCGISEIDLTKNIALSDVRIEKVI